MQCPRCGYSSPEFETCPVCEAIERNRNKIFAAPKGGFWIRLVAYLIDNLMIILGATFLTLIAALGVTLGGINKDLNPQEFENIISAYSLIIGLLSGPIYFTYFTGHGGQTPGKKVMGLRVIGKNGEDIGYGRAFLRYLCYYISFLPFGLGFLIIGFDRHKRGFHDMIVKTFVIRV